MLIAHLLRMESSQHDTHVRVGQAISLFAPRREPSLAGGGPSPPPVWTFRRSKFVARRLMMQEVRVSWRALRTCDRIPVRCAVETQLCQDREPSLMILAHERAKTPPSSLAWSRGVLLIRLMEEITMDGHSSERPCHYLHATGR